MDQRPFGDTGLQVSALTFGCGAVGGLMTKGAAADQDRAVAWARDNGINHFDTAPLYGNTVSERNLGRALGKNRDGVIVSTKVLLGNNDLADPAGLPVVVRASLEASLQRLQQDRVDIFQLHNVLGRGGIPSDRVLDAVLPAFEKLRDEGKARFLGFTANGDTEACHALIKSGRVNSAQVFFNMLVPSAGEPLPAGYPAQDYGEMLQVAKEHGVGAIGVRVLAGGALSGREDRHPLGMPTVDPIGSAGDYATDVRRARAFQPLVDDGVADSLPELAVRYAVSHPALPTTEIGIATIDELQQAAAAVNKGPLPTDALARIKEIQAGFCP
jgi:L-galactose dehydrogenase/L-glyceraldehyde 3-phosphate reductase